MILKNSFKIVGVWVLLVLLSSVGIVTANTHIKLIDGVHCIGELVNIGNISNEFKVVVKAPYGSYSAETANNLYFQPKATGWYYVEAQDRAGRELANSSFYVKDCNQQLNSNNKPNLKVSVTHKAQFNGRANYTVAIKALNLNISFYNVTNSNDFERAIASKIIAVNKTKLGLHSKRVVESFAIDPSSFEFSKAKLTKVAKGEWLYKCKDYNFAKQECYGSFQLIKRLQPGQTYTLELTKEDPLFSEVNSSFYISCYGSAETGPGSSSQATATCSNFSLLRINVPQGAVDGFIQIMEFNVSVTLATTGTAISGSHISKFDNDQVEGNSNEQTIGDSTATNSFVSIWSNTNLPNSGVASFSKSTCSNWAQGYCDWYVLVKSSFTFQGSKKTGSTEMIVNWLNYTWNYTLDEEPPAVTAIAPEENSILNHSTVVFSFNVSDNLAISSCSLFIDNKLNRTNTSITNGTTNYITSQIAEGSYSWYINCSDTTGNYNTTTPRNFTVDFVSPQISYNPATPANNSYLTKKWFVINVTASDVNLDTVMLEWQSLNESFDYSSGNNYWENKSGLADGSYSFYAYANDTAGNYNQTGLRTVTIDTVKPSVVLGSPSEYWLNYAIINFTYTPNDANLNNCSLFGNWSFGWHLNQTKSATSGVENSFNLVSLAEGSYKWNVECYDKAGNYNWSITNMSFVVDITKPVVLLESPANGSTWDSSNNVDFYFNVSDNFNNITECSIYIDNIKKDTIYNVATGATRNFSLVVQNNNITWFVNCTDAAGNSNKSETRELEVSVAEDTASPTIQLNNPEQNAYLNNSLVVFNYTPSDSTGIENCTIWLNSLDNGTDNTVTNYAANTFIRSLGKGYYYWNVSCYDNSTNHNIGWSSTRNFTIDTNPPTQFQLLSPDNDTVINVANPVMNWSATTDTNFNNYTLQISEISSFDYVNYTYVLLGVSNTSKQLTLAENNVWHWRVIAYDKAGNSYTTKTFKYTVDTSPPKIALISPTNGTWFNTTTVSFNFSVSDNFNLNSCYLVLNGTANETLSNPVNNQENTILANLSSGKYLWTVNCSDQADNTGSNSSIRVAYIDVIASSVNSYDASPEIVDLGEVVNITVNVTDNFNVSVAIAEIKKPLDSFATNFTMDKKQGDLYNLSYTDTTQRGSYTVYIYANDTLGNLVKSGPYYFYVKAGLFMNKDYYNKGEQANISGSGFDPSDNVTINITTPSGTLVDGYPKTVLCDANGNFQHIWQISNAFDSELGNYTISVYDTFSPSQSGNDWAMVVLKPDKAAKTDKNGAGLDVLAYVNESDDSRTGIVTTSNEDYIELNWNNNTKEGLVLSRITFYLQHYEPAGYNLYITWLNNSVWQDVCTINYLSSEGFSSCELTSLGLSSTAANNITLRITDKDNLGSSIGTWSYTDFAYIYLDWASISTDKGAYKQGAIAQISGSKWPINSNVTIRIDKPGGLTDFVTVMSNPQGTFTKDYQIDYDAPLGIFNVTAYATSNPSDTVKTSFQVIKRPVNIITDAVYYERGASVNITGYGFAPNNNVTLYILDKQGSYATGFPINITAGSDANGSIQFTWQISSALNTTLGKYRITANDTVYSNLANQTSIYVVLKPNTAVKLENSGQSDVLAYINDSDDSYATLSTYSGVEDYIQMNFSDNMPWNYELNNAWLFIEHSEQQSYPLVIQVFKNNQWTDACSITYTSSEAMSNCSLFGVLQHVNFTEPLLVKITDNNSDSFGNGVLWTEIDFAYIELEFSPDTDSPIVTNITPAAGSTYNFSETVTISANLSDNVYINRVFANISWHSGSQLLELSEKSVDQLGNGIYSVNFTSTLKLGRYNITIIANDTTANVNNTETSYFIVKSPDLVVNASSIGFPQEAVEFAVVQLNATVFNTGNLNATNTVVSFYERSHNTSTLIGNDVVNVTAESSTIAKVNWTAKLGTTRVEVVTDPPLATNGSIFEVNETNNNFTGNIIVRAYHKFYGAVDYKVLLDLPNNSSFLLWNQTNYMQGNIYAVDSDSNINWGSLKALSRTTSDDYAAEDFVEIDTALNMSWISDSINTTYTAAGLPKAVAKFVVYGRTISDVPIVNSTNSSAFVTGILWDFSDGSSYNGSQDVVFVTKLNHSQQGKFGVYDYELSVPARLREYVQPNNDNTITMYLELV